MLKFPYGLSFRFWLKMSFVLACILFLPACKIFEPKVQLFTKISAPNSPLLNFVKCDENEIELVDGWVWSGKSFIQNTKGGFEYARCSIYGFYKVKDAQHFGSLHFSINRYNEKVVLTPEMVRVDYLSKGHQITSPNFEGVSDKVMLRECVQDSKSFICSVGIQYDEYVTLYIVMDASNSIPVTVVQSFIESAIKLEDPLVRKYLAR